MRELIIRKILAEGEAAAVAAPASTEVKALAAEPEPAKAAPVAIQAWLAFDARLAIEATAHPNKMRFRGVLVRLDEPSQKAPNGARAIALCCPPRSPPKNSTAWSEWASIMIHPSIATMSAAKSA